MKKIVLALLILTMPLTLLAQRVQENGQVWMKIGENLYEISSVQTQTEIRPGWIIADVAKTKDKTLRYVWNPRSSQMADTNRPVFVLRTKEGTLHDFIIVKMKQKKQYRLFPKSKLEECSPMYIDLTTCIIELLPDERYLVTPKQPMEPGEYVIIDKSAKPVNDYGDVTVYGFTVGK